MKDRPGVPDQPDPDEGGDQPQKRPRWDPVVGDGQRLSEFELSEENDAAKQPDKPKEAGRVDWAEMHPQDAGAWLGVDTPPDKPKGQDWLNQDDRPPPLESTRSHDWDGWLGRVDSKDQQVLDEAFPQDADGEPARFPDPFGEWVDVVNDGGRETDIQRSNNCLDCSLSLISTWHGEPTVSAPMFPSYQDFRLDIRTGEAGGMERAERWLGNDFVSKGSGDHGLNEIERQLAEGGHGSSAVIVTSWRRGGTHAWNAVNHRGDIAWIDTQTSKVDTAPVHRSPEITWVWGIVMDREGKRL